MGMRSCPEARGWGFWNLKKTVSWDMGLDEESRFSELAEARPVVCSGGAARGGLRWKSQNRKKLCLSLLMSKNLKLKKVIKSFVPEPKESRQVFRVFSDYLCLWTFVNVLRICIFRDSLGTFHVSWSYFWTYLCYIGIILLA